MEGLEEHGQLCEPREAVGMDLFKESDGAPRVRGTDAQPPQVCVGDPPGLP